MDRHSPAGAATNHPSLLRFFEATCEAATRATGASRAGVWYFEANGSATCQRQYDGRSGQFTAGHVVSRTESPAYFEALLGSGLVAATEARSHPATAGLTESYLIPNDVHSILDFLIRDHEKQPAAILCCEQCGSPRAWSERDVMALHGLAGQIGETFRYQAGTGAQRAMFTPDLPFADEPLLLDAAIYWAAKRSSRGMPLRRDLSPIDMPRPLLPHLVIAELEPAPFRVRFRLVGTEMVTRYGRDFTGLTIEDFMTGAYADYISGLFRKVRDSGQPVYSESTFKWNDGGYGRTRRLMLPLSVDGGEAVQQVLVAQVWTASDGRPVSPMSMPVRTSLIDNRIGQSLNLPVLRRNQSAA